MNRLSMASGSAISIYDRYFKIFLKTNFIATKLDAKNQQNN